MRSSFSLLVVLAGGCALFPLGEADCKGVNWHQVGYNDGYFGAPKGDLRFKKECKKRFGVEVDQAAYLEGYRVGYIEYERIHPSGDGGMRPR